MSFNQRLSKFAAKLLPANVGKVFSVDSNGDPSVIDVLNNAALTGTPTAPTPAQFDVSTSIATMEALHRELGSFSGIKPLATSAVLTAADVGKLIYMDNSTAFTVTLPSIATVPLGATITFFNLSSGTPSNTVQCAGTDIIQRGGSVTITSLQVGVGDTLRLIKASSTTWVTVGKGYAVGDVIRTISFYDAGSATSSASYVSAQGASFSFTPRRAGSRILGLYSFGAEQVAVNGVNYYAYHNVYETVSASYIAIDRTFRNVYTNGGTGMSATITQSFDATWANNATRSIQLRHQSSLASGSISTTGIRLIITEVVQ